MKNPFMSMWLSAANRSAGTARGLWAAEAKRQQTALAKKTAAAMGLGGKKKTATKRKPR